LLREVAKQYLPKDLIYRKKGFTVPSDRNQTTVKFFEQSINRDSDIVFRSHYEKLSFAILHDFFKKNSQF
jgi:hypothetical protein